MNDKNLEQKIAKETDEILLLISLNKGMTREQIVHKYRTSDNHKLTAVQMRLRLRHLKDVEKIHYRKERGSVFWYPGVGDPEVKRDPVEKIKPFKISADLSGLPQPLRYFGGYV